MLQLFSAHTSRVQVMFNGYTPDTRRINFIEQISGHVDSYAKVPHEPPLHLVQRSNGSYQAAQQCKQWITEAQKFGNHQQGNVGNGERRLGTRNVDIWSYESESLLKTVKTMIWDFQEKSNWNMRLVDIEVPQFCVYYGTKNSHYTWHKDSRNFLHPQLGERKISLSMLLNDSSEFKGGELDILTGMSEAGKPLVSTANLKDPGDVVFFRSDQYHRVRPVTQGTRAVMVVWCWGTGNF